MSEPLLWTTAETAEQIRMSEDFVRDHAGELGGVKAGRGPRAPLRFEPDRVRGWIARNRIPCGETAEIPPPSPSPKPQAPAGIDLLERPSRSLLTARG